jgi:hypothetical protein
VRERHLLVVFFFPSDIFGGTTPNTPNAKSRLTQI